jgi:hypothetical protein
MGVFRWDLEILHWIPLAPLWKRGEPEGALAQILGISSKDPLDFRYPMGLWVYEVTSCGDNDRLLQPTGD